jgi:hypothetical protein
MPESQERDQMNFKCLVRDGKGNHDFHTGLVCLEPDDKARRIASQVAGMVGDSGALELKNVYGPQNNPTQWVYVSNMFTYYVSVS